MVTDFKCWWQNHYVGDFFRYVVDFLNLLNRSPTVRIGHQHLKCVINTFRLQPYQLNIPKDITKSINSGFQHSKNGFVIIITIGFEEISKFLFFSCPCERPWNFRYGLLFIFGPAFLLWLVGILAQERFQKLFRNDKRRS